MIRRYGHADAEALEEMFTKQGFEYERPDFGDPNFLSKTVMEKNGKISMAILARLTAEAYFLIDPEFSSPQEKWEAFKELHEAARLDCYARGLDDIYCWVPPQIKKPFGRRLMRLGWTHNLWPAFNRSLHTVTEDLKEGKKCASLQESSAT